MSCIAHAPFPAAVLQFSVTSLAFYLKYVKDFSLFMAEDILQPAAASVLLAGIAGTSFVFHGSQAQGFCPGQPAASEETPFRLDTEKLFP